MIFRYRIRMNRKMYSTRSYYIVRELVDIDKKNTNNSLMQDNKKESNCGSFDQDTIFKIVIVYFVY